MTLAQSGNALLLLCTAFAGQIWADPKLFSLRMMPQESTLRGKQASQQFLVIGKFADNRERDLTGQARFALSNPASARADESGRLFATADGATGRNRDRQRPFREGRAYDRGLQSERPFSFPRDIVSIFTRRGCNTAGCHGGIKGQARIQAVPPTESIRKTTTSGLWKAVCSRS